MWIAAIVIWSLIGNFVYGDDLSLWSFLGPIGMILLIEEAPPLIRVIICNYRKVPYHG